MKPDKLQKTNRYRKHENVDDIDKIFRTSESTATKINKQKPRISIIAYIKNIIKSIFFRNNKNKSTINNSATNDSEYFLSSQHSSPDKNILPPSLQSHATKLTQDNNINTIKDNNKNSSLTFSTFGKEIKNLDQDITQDKDQRSSPSPLPPLTRSSSNINTIKDNNKNSSLTFSTFGKEIKNLDQDITQDKDHRSSPSPLPPLTRSSSLNRNKGRNNNTRG